MGWMIKRIGSNRETLKRSIREALEKDRGASGSAHPARVASAVDAMVDIFPGFNGLTLEITTQGTLDVNGSGAASVTITTISSDEMI
jgi:hypothetical protein